MKNKLVFSCLAAAGICMAGLAGAADVAQPGTMQDMHAQHHAMHDPVVAAQKRLDQLGAKLNLKSSQQEAWKTFTAAALKHAQEHAQQMAAHGPAEQAKMEGLSTPDKLEMMAQRMRQGADRLSKLAGETKPFYDQLSTEQKTIFDLYAKNAWHDRMHRRMMDRMH